MRDEGRGFPENCLRGLRDKNCIIPGEGRVNTGAYIPPKKSAEGRDDGKSELSINWEDDEGALALIFGRRSQSEFGVARLARDSMEFVRQRADVAEMLAYERRRMDDNDYHGNILLNAVMPSPLEKEIAAALALFSTLIPRQR